MPTIKEITTLCKAGEIDEAYRQAMSDYEADSSNIWNQREVGWALYYLIKADADVANYEKLCKHLEQLAELDQLKADEENLIFDNVVMKVAWFIKNHLSLTSFDSPVKLSGIFKTLRGQNFAPSKGYSFLLQAVMKFDGWPELADFFDWWNLNKLSDEDYTPYINERGRKLLTTAERAFIANSKALLRLNDIGRIQAFLPKLEHLMQQHPEMMYPGYYYGKLLIAIGSSAQDELQAVLPFARKKVGEFWVWDLLSTIFQEDPDKQLACLLRAVNCKTQEQFLGKIRVKLAQLYLRRNMPDCARYHIDTTVRCYMSNGWRLPAEIDDWIHQEWLNVASPNPTSPINFMAITNQLLFSEAKEAIGIVAYVDPTTKRASIIYGKQMRTAAKLPIKASPGMALLLNYAPEDKNRIRILSAKPTNLTSNLPYAKIVEGVVKKRDDKNYAFLKSGGDGYFIAANCVTKYKLKNGQPAKGLVVLDFRKKDQSWNWQCLRIMQ
jgi:hypothetical protein